MPKYWVKNYFAHGRFPEVGQKQKTEGKKERGAKVGENNGQATHGARKQPGPIMYKCRSHAKGFTTLLSLSRFFCKHPHFVSKKGFCNKKIQKI